MNPLLVLNFLGILRCRADSLDTLGITAKELAARLGISAPRISSYIHAKSEPTQKIARGLCDELHLTPAQILGY